jgi:toxin ParE1/3/4
MNYKISQEAALDLEGIWIYTFKNWSVDQADRYLNLLFNEIEYLAENPGSGKDLNEIRKGYFLSPVKSHLILYKLDLKNEKLLIIRILHKRMDLESLITK